MAPIRRIAAWQRKGSVEEQRNWRLDVNSNAWSSRLVLGLGAVVFGVVAGMLMTASNPLYFAAGLVGVFAALAILKDTQIGLVAFIAVASLLPFGVIPVPLGTVKLTFIDATLTALLLIWLARVLTQPGEKMRFGRVGGYVLLFVFLAFVAFIAGSAYGVTPETSRLFLKIVNSILFFFTVINCVRTRKQLDQVVAALIIAGAGAALVGLALYFMPAADAARLLSSLRILGYPSGDVLRYIANTDTLRAIATSIDPNILGGILMLTSALGINQFLSSTPVIARKWLAPMLGASLLALLLTYSRGSWIGLVVAVVFLATIKYRRLWFIFGLVLVAVVLGVMPSDISFVGHLQSGLSFQDQAAAMRLGEYKDAINLISKYPWFGVGFGEPPSIDLYVGVSSIYLLMAEQMGIIGLAAFVFIMGNVLFLGLRQILTQGGAFSMRLTGTVTQPGHHGTHLLGLLATLVAALTAVFFDHYFFNLRFSHTVAIFWLIVGLVMVALEFSRSQADDPGITPTEIGPEPGDPSLRPEGSSSHTSPGGSAVGN